MKLIDQIHGLLLRAANALQSPLLLAVRLYWGWQFWQAGWGKLTNIAKPIDYFSNQLHLPLPVFNAYFISGLETAGGILLALGLGSRVIALLLTGDMVVAYWVADRDALGAIFSDPGTFYNATPFTFLFAALLILIFGPGLFSLDTAIERHRKKRQQPAPS